MSNSVVVRAMRRRISSYLDNPVFNKYGRFLRDFLGVISMAIGALLLILFILFLFIDDIPFDYRSSCGYQSV